MSMNINGLTNKVNNSISAISNSTKDLFNFVGKNILPIDRTGEEQTVEIIMYIIIGLVVLIFVMWAYNISTLKNRDCEKLDKIYYNADTMISPISRMQQGNKFEGINELFNGSHAVMNAYYVKTAYNCCSPGDMKNSFVNICALKKCIQLGARCLDFEIYSENGRPVIATAIVNSSLNNSFYIKQTFNSIDLVDVLYTILYFAYNSDNGGAPNSTDPLFLHMRIMTTEEKTINLIAKYLNEIIGDKLLGIEYGNNNYDMPMSNKNIVQFSNKCIIMVEQNNLNITTILNSNLYPMVNIMTNTEGCHLKRMSELMNEDVVELVNYNKYYMTMILPDLSPSSTNNNPASAFTTGCQFIGMHFQNFDTNLEFYFKVFDETRYSFVLKPCNKRYIPTHYLVNPIADSEKGTTCSRSSGINTGHSKMNVSLDTGNGLRHLNPNAATPGATPGATPN